MSLENGILGYLSIKPLSGYDIKKLFNMSAAYFWPADQAQIYRSLKKLLDDGSIEIDRNSKGESITRKVYAITDLGRQVLHDWIIEPKMTDFISRLPFIMRLFFSGVLSREEQLAFLDAQLEINNQLQQKLQENFKKNSKEFAKIEELLGRDRRFESATYASRWGILRGEAYGKLLEEIKAEILAKGN